MCVVRLSFGDRSASLKYLCGQINSFAAVAVSSIVQSTGTNAPFYLHSGGSDNPVIVEYATLETSSIDTDLSDSR